MRLTLKFVLPSVLVALAVSACGSSSSSGTSSSSSQATSTAAASAPQSSQASGSVVETASNSKLGATVLVDAQGMTVYHLSGESAGKFICTGACEANWPPVSASAMSHAIGGLGTVKRPDGMEQLAYKGEPLYTFAGDKAPGQANGQGVKDVGTWSAVTVAAGTSSKPASSAPASASGEGSGGGGYGY
jgi:predicted lipoprotein with Yx(FWY)xxD motif